MSVKSASSVKTVKNKKNEANATVIIARSIKKFFLAIFLILIFFLSINIAWLGPWTFQPNYWKPHLTYGDSLNEIYVSAKTPNACKLKVVWYTSPDGYRDGYPASETNWIKQPDVIEATEGIYHDILLSDLKENVSIKYHLEVLEEYKGQVPSSVSGDLGRDFVIPGRVIINQTLVDQNLGNGINRLLKIALYGDNRPTVFGTANHKYVVNAINKVKPDFVVNVGDIVQTGGNDMEWARFFNTGESMLRTIPLMPTPGNHEYYSGLAYDQGDLVTPKNYLDAFRLPGNESYYSYAIGKTVMISLDISGGHGAKNDDIEAAQEHWLDNYLYDLNQTSGGNISAYYDWLMVFFHYPIESSGEMHEAVWTEILAPIFEKYSVLPDLFIVGHVHQYERIYLQTAKTWSILTAGGGAEIEQWKGGALAPGSERIELSHSFITIEINGRVLTMKALLLDGTEFDSLILNKTS